MNHSFTNKGIDRSDPKIIIRLGILLRGSFPSLVFVHGLGETPTLFACQRLGLRPRINVSISSYASVTGRFFTSEPIYMLTFQIFICFVRGKGYEK